MFRSLLALCTGLSWLCLCSVGLSTDVAAQDRVDSRRTAYVGGRVLSMVEGEEERSRPATVVVSGDRIEAVLSTGEELPENTRKIDVSGLWLMPGLADMHVHFGWTEEEQEADSMFAREPMGAMGRLLVAHGVTFVRSMWGTPSILEQRDRWNRGDGIGPRMITSGPLMTGASGSPILFASTDSERATVSFDEQVRLGYDLIKVHSNPPASAYWALCDAATAAGIPIDGHVPFSVDAVELLVRSPQRTVEHVGRFVGECVADGSPGLGEPWPQMMQMYDHQSAEKRGFLARVVAASGKWVCPTINVDRWEPLSGEELGSKLADDALARFVTPRTREYWRAYLVNTGMLYRRVGIDPKNQFKAPFEILEALVAADVRIVAGTDTPVRPGVPGRVLHEELALYVEAGMTPYQALVTATRAPAECVGAAGDFGVIRPGARADFVCLTADPLLHIEALTSIAGVCRAGRWRDREALDRLLDDAATIVAH